MHPSQQHCSHTLGVTAHLTRTSTTQPGDPSSVPTPMPIRMLQSCNLAYMVRLHDTTKCSSSIALRGSTADGSLTKDLQKRPQRPAIMSGTALFSFGIVSDVQYADIDDRTSFHGCPRFYRNSLVALKRAVSHWRQHHVSFALSLGDIIDGFTPQGQAEEGLTAALAPFEALGRPAYHLVGNHCLYNLPHDRLNERLGIPRPPDGASYYSWSPHPAWRFIALDAYDLSVLGWPEDHPRYTAAKHILDTKNPNENKHSPAGLDGLQKRFVMFGGGVSSQQLAWLEQQLQEAKAANQAAVVLSHVPLHPDTCCAPCVLWNYEQVIPLLQQSGVVVATFAGHTHQNGYCCDESGIHHMVLPSVLETPPGRDAYGWVDVCAEGLQVHGVDAMPSYIMRHPAAVAAAAAVAALPQSMEVAKSAVAAAGKGPGAGVVFSMNATAAPVETHQAQPQQQQQQQQQVQPEATTSSSSKAAGSSTVSIDLTAHAESPAT